MELEERILKYIESKGFIFDWCVNYPQKETDFLGFIISDEKMKIIYLHGWYTGKLLLEDKSYLLALLIAHYEIYGKDQKVYGFKINNIQEITKLDKEVIDRANAIMQNIMVLMR